MRNLLACVACRTAKRQCIHNNHPPCQRCKDRSEPCYFPLPGTSFIHRQPRLRRSTRRTSISTPGIYQLPRPDHRLDDVAEIEHLELKNDAISPDLSAINPFDLLTDEVKNSYLRCSYKWSFHHIPSLLVSVRKGTLDRWVIWSILALSIRFCDVAPLNFGTPLEASNAFAAHARATLLPSIEEPTVSRIQALLMITGHSWGAGEGRRAWIHLGLAIRMAQAVGLFEEIGATSSREEFIVSEERRRTAWTCFLMDSLLSGGKGRRRMLEADDMRIQLPCDSESFTFGEPVECEWLDGTLLAQHRNSPTGKLGIVAYSMRAADIWGGVARWACSLEADRELPWELDSKFHRLFGALDTWRRSLPDRLEYSVYCLHAHSASEHGQAYAYMHCIYFMSMMFLHRSYLPSLPEIEPRIAAQPSSPLDERLSEWRTNSRKELLRAAGQVCEMLEEMRAFGLFFLRGLVPWIGFTAYTATGIMLYYYHFPPQDDDIQFMERARSHVLNGCAFLKDMRGSWPMVDTWRETIKRMQIFYCKVKTTGEQFVTATERTEMRNAIIDYGALQHSPVNHNSHSRGPQMASTRRSLSVSESHSAHSDISATSPVEQAQQEYFPTDFDIFGVDFNMDDVDLEAAVLDATTGFWSNFPGEVQIF